MIRLRRKDKSTIVLPKDIIFVEFVSDEDGKVIQVFSQYQASKTFHSFGYPSEQAQRYEKYFNVDFIKQFYDLGDGKSLEVKK